MSETCPRCGASLPTIDASPAPFCAVCGLPQLRVSEDAITATDTPDASATVPSNTIVSVGGVNWRTALPVALLAAVAALVPAISFPGALALGGVGGICLLFVPLAALAAVFVYGRRSRNAPLSARIGGRIGATTGLFLAALVAAGTGLASYILRYGRHSRELERVLTDSVNQAIGQFRINSGTIVPPETLAWLHAPEVRAGWFIAVQVFLALLLIGLGAIFGALGGALLQSRRQRRQP